MKDLKKSLVRFDRNSLNKLHLHIKFKFAKPRNPQGLSMYDVTALWEKGLKNDQLTLLNPHN